MNNAFRFFTLLVAYFFIAHFKPSTAQFPIVCMENATLPDARCCPIPEGFTEPCGGKKRGRCAKIRLLVSEEQNATRLSKIPEVLWQDDRIDWPSRFFTYYCKCSGKFDGAACDRCKSGYTGVNCKEKATRVRRNAATLSVEEQRLLRDVINASKFTPSEYAVMSISTSKSADPAKSENMAYYNVSVYDYMVYIHFYASRSTMLDDKMQTCDPNLHILDFAHKGPAFLPWHRHYLLLFENELARIAQTQFNASNFSLAYWDWTARENASSCSICTNDLVGDIEDSNDGQTSVISPNSPFSQWRPICKQSSLPDDCHVCDLEATENDENPGYWEQESLWREYSLNEEWSELPTQEDINNTMIASVYDELPFNASASNMSFRNCIEGFAQLGSKQGPVNMHNLVHSYFNGTWFDTATSPNDPLFLFHHTFVDKLFELWISSKTEKERKVKKLEDAPLGHQYNSYMVPFYPVVRMSSYLTKQSRKFGYIYDDNLAGDSPIISVTDKDSFSITAADAQNTSGSSLSSFLIQLSVAILVVTVIVVAFVLGRTCHNRKSRRPYTEIKPELSSISSLDRIDKERRAGTSEKTPLLSTRF